MRRAALLVLVLLLAACGGGGGDDDDDEPTATARRPRATATSAALSASPVVPRPSPVASPTAVPEPTATATRRPATIAAPPRPIAAQSTEAPIRPVAQATATSSSTDGVVYDDSFDDGDTEFFTGTSESGVTASIVDGRYQLDIPDGGGYYTTSNGQAADAFIATDVSITGDGTAGLVARGINVNDQNSLFLCWIEANTTVGCHKLTAGEWTLIWESEAGAYTLQEVNRLVFTIVGSTLYFDVNGQNLITLEDASLPDPGYWGVYGDSQSGAVSVAFDWVTVAETAEYTEPAPAEGGAIAFDEFTIVYEENFDDGTTDLATGPTDIGITSTVTNGAYVVEFPDQTWSTFPVGTMDILGDGLVVINASISGEGVMGVLARSFGFEDGTFDYYICWLSSEQTAGCHASIKNEWTQLWQSDAGVVPVQQVNELVLAVTGSQLTFMVNGEALVTLEDSTIVDGYWGLYGQSFSGATTVTYDDLMVASWTGGS
jgi:hypothetical protein